MKSHALSSHRCTNLTRIKDGICLHEIFNIIRNQNKNNKIQLVVGGVEKTIEIFDCGPLYKILYDNKRYSLFKNIKVVSFHTKFLIHIETIFNLEQFKSLLEQYELDEGIYYEHNKAIKSIKYEMEEFFNNDSYRNIYRYLLSMNELTAYYREQIKLGEEKCQKITSLINYGEYYANKNKNYTNFEDIIESEKRSALMNKLMYCGSGKTIFLTGPCGIGKSITLMYFTLKNMGIISSCYLNLKYLIKQKSIMTIKSVFQKAVSTLYLNEDDYLNAMKTINKIDFSSTKWKIIKNLILLLIKDNREHIIILDQYKIDYDPNNTVLNELANLINDSKISLVICSSINVYDIRECLLKKWINTDAPNYSYEYISELLLIETKHSDKQSETISKTFEVFSNLPKYCNDILNLNCDDEIIQYRNKQKNDIKSRIRFFYKNEKNVFNILIKLKYCLGKQLKEEQFCSIIQTIPLKFFEVTKQDSSYIISPHFNLIIDVIDEILVDIGRDISNKNDLFPDIEEDKTYQGIVFELFFHLKIKLDKSPFTNLKYDELYYVKNLMEFNIWSGQDDIDLNKTPKTLYIQPKNSNSPYFDSAFLYYNKNEYYLIAFQVSIGKKKSQMMERTFIEEKLNILKEEIEKKKKIHINENKLYFFYIFPYESPKKSNLQYCAIRNIPIIFFSVRDMMFSLLTRDTRIYVNIQFPFSQTFKKYKNTHLLNYINNSLQKLEQDCTEKILFLNKKTKRSEGSLSEVEKDMILKLIDKPKYKMIFDVMMKRVAMGCMMPEENKLYVIHYNKKRYAVYLEDIYINVDEKNTKIIDTFKKWKLYYNYMHNPTDTGVEWYILLKNEK